MERSVRLPRLFLLACLLVFPAATLARGGQADEDCLACHGDPDLKSGEGRSLFVDAAKYAASIHGSTGASCVNCHADLKGFSDFPHPERLKTVDCSVCHAEAADAIRRSVHGRPGPDPKAVAARCQDCHGTHEIRASDDAQSHTFAINIPDTCISCHSGRVRTKPDAAFVDSYKESVHFRALSRAGLTLSATCVSCHGGHDVRAVDDPESKVSRRRIIGTCGKCHVGIERDYVEGVHGKDYVKGIEDVPLCTNCHSEHDIRAPEDLSSRVYATKVAGVCSRCHDDERLGRQYGFLTSRLKTYSASYHGTASKFGEARVANCASCHGHHDIRPSSDPRSSINAANLASTCGTCHPGAGDNFSKGRIHIVSEKTENRWGYSVKIFYIVAIAGLISIFLAFIAADLYRRLRIRWKR